MTLTTIVIAIAFSLVCGLVTFLAMVIWPRIRNTWVADVLFWFGLFLAFAAIYFAFRSLGPVTGLGAVKL